MRGEAKRFTILLNARGDFIRAEFAKNERREIDRFVAPHEARIEEQERPVVRYDGAHGFAHRDLLASDGSAIEKTPMPAGLSDAQARTEAVADLKANWPRYRTDYLERRP